MRVKVRINRAGINAATQLEGVYRNLEKRGDRVISAAGFSVIERSGAYRRGLRRDRIRVRGRGGVRVTATAGHSAVLELGSRPHIIEPKTKKALAWPGGAHPVRRVHHPGTKARHTLRNALKAARL
ncbi:hypothetical protein [Paractinoplanes toevensis]|uniref:HK97 gp10 family phage protein n=1 Tax=Paractinoplanes toevensis TaxID=571911 RepID=A0A919T686_9ACTN|nr:hypothetical protein [Actinoplanes toevensis]GIM88756.1 hypothetical protein Ato02nite_005490 [Actinoplanes toevensis]